jgi:MYXO-CTERM domain-containing protein
MKIQTGLFMAGLAGALALSDGPARACGCFTPPDPSVPVVQAGERILFSVDNGQVTAHIQIQYSGAAGDFGWLLPLPSVPKLELGTDEVFNTLTAQTQPKYHLTRVFNGNCRFPTVTQGANFGASPNSGGDGDKSQDPPIVVIQSSVGPYDYAVLHGDSKQDMLDWLAANRYFVPAGTDDVVQNYVHPGAYFLALKLHPGAQVGDLQPVVVHYASDLPMIPIVLSSVAAQPDMGIQVWMLGAGRAIPRNYYHTVINDAAIDWQNAGQNYNDVIIRATREAPGRHTFVTEYAGSAAIMRNLLDRPGRFGDASQLAAITDPVAFVQKMLQNGYPLSAQVTAILGEYIPEPTGITASGVSAAQFYSNLSYYLGQYRRQHPQLWERAPMHFDPVALAAQLDQRVAQPTLAAGALFSKYPYLTRLYTTLSPEDMNRDPVFSYNPGLPDWPNVHNGTMSYECGLAGTDAQDTTYAWLRTADGFTYAFPAGTRNAQLPSQPASRLIQILRETGDPEVVTDNTGAIASDLGQSNGCSVSVGARRSGAAGLALLALAVAALIVRRRRSERA